MMTKSKKDETVEVKVISLQQDVFNYKAASYFPVGNKKRRKVQFIIQSNFLLLFQKLCSRKMREKDGRLYVVFIFFGVGSVVPASTRQLVVPT